MIEKLDRYINKVLNTLPTQEELGLNFPHSEECLRSKPLKNLEKEEVVDSDGMNSGWVHGPFIRVMRKYLECDECHVQARYGE